MMKNGFPFIIRNTKGCAGILFIYILYVFMYIYMTRLKKKLSDLKNHYKNTIIRTSIVAR